MEFISIGANRQPHASDYNRERDIVAYGSGRSIAIWADCTKSTSKVVGTINGHEKMVTSVKFLADDILVSGSADSSIRVWRLLTFDKGVRYECIDTVNPSSKSITALAVHKATNTIVSGSAAGEITVFRFKDDNNNKLSMESKQTINDRFYPLCLAIHQLQDTLIIAVGGTLNHVYIFTNYQTGEFELGAMLEGHENWVRSLDFTNDCTIKGDVLLASASQDRYIRLWRIRKGGFKSEQINKPAELLEVGSTLSNKVYHLNDKRYSIVFDSLIMGHDDWIFSVSWNQSANGLELLSSSADTSLMVWNPDESSGVWICSSRLGDVSIKGASTATGASGGFWCGLWLGKESQYISAVGKTGSWRLWHKNIDQWESVIGISGHVQDVSDLSWDEDGRYLLSTSLDQTTRLFSTWKTNNDSWHEISRPQIHGYDMIAVKSLNPQVFVSGGDEKTLRVFEQPKGIAYLLENVCGVVKNDKVSMPESAIVPALGLSNKQEQDAYERNEQQDDEEEEENNTTRMFSVLSALSQPPFEDHLQRQTLWPETDKLYGHGYEISCLAVSHDKSVIATCCKANTESHAVIRLYDIKSWQQLPMPLKFHTLTVTRVQFSPNDKYLLSVSRDRQWAMWERTEQNNYKFSTTEPKGHNRIIWDCAWIPDSKGFITASRDKHVRLWRLDEHTHTWNTVHQVSFDNAVTAVDVEMTTSQVAIGLETGSLFIYQVQNNNELVFKEKIDNQSCPDMRINRLSWRPNNSNQFAVASEDTSVRVYSL